jgi:hypothetical protein
MKLGLITDIHEQVELLRSAVARLRQMDVDQIVVIGDLFATGERLTETCQLLDEQGVVGVWGNHDAGLCLDPKPELQQRYGPVVVDYMATLKPRLEIEGCLFQHIEPWLDPNELMDLWYFEGIPNSPEKIARIFRAVPHRTIFAGHYHGWLLVNTRGPMDWSGETTVRLPTTERFFVVIGALCEGRFATFDTETAELVPFTIA